MQPGDVARKLFAQIDLNGDGVLSAQETRAYLERNGEEELGNAIFAQLDVDGDGVRRVSARVRQNQKQARESS